MIPLTVIGILFIFMGLITDEGWPGLLLGTILLVVSSTIYLNTLFS